MPVNDNLTLKHTELGNTVTATMPSRPELANTVDVRQQAPEPRPQTPIQPPNPNFKPPKK